MFDPSNDPSLFSPFMFSFVFDTVKYLIIYGGAFYLLRYYLKHQRKDAPSVAVSGEKNVILPLKLQAYERFVLFLERIHPSSLVMRLNNPDLTALQLQSLAIRTIREEYEYNLSQQLYIGSNLWSVIKNAKEETVALINQSAVQLPAEAMSGDLVQMVFAMSVAKGSLPVEMALDEIKKELQANFS